MRNYNKERSLTALAALLIFALFAIGILSVLLGGAGVYRRLTLRNEASYDSRTCTQYIATKLRQASSPGAVAVAAFGEGDALVIAEEIEGARFLTRVYCHNGWLMELFTVADGAFAPEDGEKILPLEALSLTQNGQLLEISLTDTRGDRRDLALYLRESGGMQP